MKFIDLNDVNVKWNDKITYVSDDIKYRTPEQWEDATERGYKGDCEDYSIAKLHELVKRGWPIELLRLAFCWVGPEQDRSGHAVLLAEYDNQLWVLDNRFDELREVSDCLDYVWNTCQEIGGSMNWKPCSEVFAQFYTSKIQPE